MSARATKSSIRNQERHVHTNWGPSWRWQDPIHILSSYSRKKRAKSKIHSQVAGLPLPSHPPFPRVHDWLLLSMLCQVLDLHHFSINILAWLPISQDPKHQLADDSQNNFCAFDPTTSIQAHLASLLSNTFTYISDKQISLSKYKLLSPHLRSCPCILY